MSVSFQSEVQKKKKKMSICGTILPKIFNRKLRGSAAKEQKIKIALLLKKKKKCPKFTVHQKYQEGNTQSTNLSMTTPQNF